MAGDTASEEVAVELTQRDPTLRQLTCFKEVAEHLSFKSAADALSMSQPALSIAIRDLEISVGTVLFHRSAHHVRLSAAGEAIRPKVEWLVNSHRVGMADLRRLLKYKVEALRVGCMPAVAHLVAPWAAQWHKDHPLVLLEWSDMHANGIGAALASGEIDIGIGLNPAPDESLESHLVIEDDIVAVLPAGHRFAPLKSLPWSELKGESLVILATQGSQQMATHVLEQQGVAVARIQFVEHVASLAAMLDSGLGIGLMPRLHAGGLHRADLSVHALRSPTLSQHIYLMRRRASSQHQALIRSCWDFLREKSLPAFATDFASSRAGL
ncbi:LysR family transcriptional regulator [Comamonas humi]